MILQGKVAIVTGGASGIGAATARVLSREGAHVVVASDQALDVNERVCEQIRSDGGSADAAVADVRNGESLNSLVAGAVSRRGRLDVVVNAAGVFHLTPVWGEHALQIEQLFTVNALGAINMIRASLPALRLNGGGSIVSIASAGGVLGGETYAEYCASKAALIHYTRTLAPELRRTRIRINCIAPGAVRTPMTAAFHSPTTAVGREALERRTETCASPYGSAFAEPDEIANVALFLVSDAARAIHGACIVADHGETSAMPLPG